MHATVDKFATLNKEGNAILYTTKDNPTAKQVISLAEGKRIFEDIYGDISIRWEVTDAYKLLALRKAKSQARRTNSKGSK